MTISRDFFVSPEKRELVIRQKKEANDKAREEKRVAEEKAREEERLAKETEKATSPKEKPNSQVKEKENGTEVPRKNCQILRRATNDISAAAAEEADMGESNGIIAEGTSVKPKEIIRDIPSQKPNRVGPNAVSSPLRDTIAEPTNSFTFGQATFSDSQHLDANISSLLNPHKRKGPEDPETAIYAA